MSNPRLFVAITLMGIIVLSNACIKVDFFLFDPLETKSLQSDYHGLPLFQGTTPPSWIDETQVEREIYFGPHQQLHGVFLPAPRGCPIDECPLIQDSITFLYQPGNSGNMFTYWYRAVALWSLGANVFIYTYRGYGLSGGEASCSNIIHDAEAALQYVLSRNDVTKDRVVAYGYSFGGIPTSYLAGKSAYKAHLKAVILEAALSSPESLLQLSVGTAFPNGFFLEDPAFNGVEYIQGTQLPILHMHGGKDQRVPPLLGKEYQVVLHARPNYTEYLGETKDEIDVWMAQCGHRNIPDHSFQAEEPIAHYWGNGKNPSHCCVHPLEWLNSENEGFLVQVGGTSREEGYQSIQDYRFLIASWVHAMINQ